MVNAQLELAVPPRYLTLDLANREARERFIQAKYIDRAFMLADDDDTAPGPNLPTSTVPLSHAAHALPRH